MWLAVAAQFDSGGKSDIDQADRLREAATLHGAAQVDRYLCVFHTDAMSPRKSLINKPLATAQPGLAAALAREAERLVGLLDLRRAAAMRDRTHALLTIATSVAKHYRDEKQARGLLDYDDLIDKALQMLDRIGSSWVHFKLDRGIDHVLIDEAQDTSPRQWDIVAHLITEFTAGKGARDGVKRTVFAVGDEKQSIFSFQGAAPREFAARRTELRRKFEGAGLKFDPVSFTYSFRSGEAILASVDSVFRDEQIYRSIHAEDAYPVHQSLADAGPSLIDLWELEQRRCARRDRRLAAAVRCEIIDQPRDQTRAARPDRNPRAGHGRHADRTARRAPNPALWRRAGSGATARRGVRRHHSGAEARRRAGGGRRPAQADRAHRDHRSDEPRRCPVVAAGRSCARCCAEEPAVRPRRRRPVQAGVAAQGFATPRARSPCAGRCEA